MARRATQGPWKAGWYHFEEHLYFYLWNFMPVASLLW